MIIIDKGETEEQRRAKRIQKLQDDWPFREGDESDRTLTCPYCNCIFEVTIEDILDGSKVSLGYEVEFGRRGWTPDTLKTTCPNPLGTEHPSGTWHVRSYRKSRGLIDSFVHRKNYY